MKKGLGRISLGNWNKANKADPSILSHPSTHLDDRTNRTLWLFVNETEKPSAKVFDKIIKGMGTV
jgi:hypothetical protein